MCLLFYRKNQTDFLANPILMIRENLQRHGGGGFFCLDKARKAWGVGGIWTGWKWVGFCQRRKHRTAWEFVELWYNSLLVFFILLALASHSPSPRPPSLLIAKILFCISVLRAIDVASPSFLSATSHSIQWLRDQGCLLHSSWGSLLRTVFLSPNLCAKVQAAILSAGLSHLYTRELLGAPGAQTQHTCNETTLSFGDLNKRW